MDSSYQSRKEGREMSLLTDALPWLEELLEESAGANTRLSPVKPGETIVGDVPQNLRPLLKAIHHLREKMRDGMTQYENRPINMEEFVRFHKEMDGLQQQHDTVTGTFWFSLRMALGIHGRHIIIREDWTVVSRDTNDRSKTIVVDGDIGGMLGELVRATETPGE
ncbi:MAG: hypothetical protein WC246_01185 [Candidatus Paceibacterota bacterium]